MSVTVVKYNQLNENQKERIANKLANGSLYQQLWFVKCLTDEQFYLFIYGDLEALLMIPYRKKMGITYAYRPLFLQQNTFFGDYTKYEYLIKALQNTIKYGDITLDQLPSKHKFLQISSRKNYELSLEKSYIELKQNFSKNHKRNINKSKELILREVDNITDLLKIFKGEKQTSLTNKLLKDIHQTIQKLVQNPKIKPHLKIVNCYSENQVVGAFLLLIFNNRIYYLLGTSVKKNTNLSDKALYRLFDELIQNHAETNTILDFEGSDLSGVARFFKGFGAKETSYYAVKWNELPFPFNKLKS
jgi:hypothetical protein